MVDSIKPVGFTAPLTGSKDKESAQERSESKAAQKTGFDTQDTVEISGAALNKAEAENVSLQLRASLSQNGRSLGLDPAFDTGA